MNSRLAFVAVFALSLMMADAEAQVAVRNKSRSNKSYVRRASCNGGGCSAGSASSGIVTMPSSGGCGGCEMASTGGCYDPCPSSGCGGGGCGGGGSCGCVLGSAHAVSFPRCFKFKSPCSSPVMSCDPCCGTIFSELYCSMQGFLAKMDAQGGLFGGLFSCSSCSQSVGPAMGGCGGGCGGGLLSGGCGGGLLGGGSGCGCTSFAPDCGIEGTMSYVEPSCGVADCGGGGGCFQSLLAGGGCGLGGGCGIARPGLFSSLGGMLFGGCGGGCPGGCHRADGCGGGTDGFGCGGGGTCGGGGGAIYGGGSGGCSGGCASGYAGNSAGQYYASTAGNRSLKYNITSNGARPEYVAQLPNAPLSSEESTVAGIPSETKSASKGKVKPSSFTGTPTSSEVYIVRNGKLYPVKQQAGRSRSPRTASRITPRRGKPTYR